MSAGPISVAGLLKTFVVAQRPCLTASSDCWTTRLMYESLFVIGPFVVSFGFVKAVLNLYAGKWGEQFGRKPVLVAGWATALPLPVILIFAPTWSWITIGNVLPTETTLIDEQKPR